MYPPRFDYYRASTLNEALSLLNQHSGAKVIAGGHSLIPLMKLRLADPGEVIDIGRLTELKGISNSGGTVKIGGLTTHAMVATSRLVPAGLAEAAAMIGDPQVRNRGTVGGNISHADPGSDLPTILLALGAIFHTSGLNGERAIPADNFFTGLFETALQPDEILTRVEVPLEGQGSGSAYAKLPHPASRYAIVGAGVLLTVEGGTCTQAASLLLASCHRLAEQPPWKGGWSAKHLTLTLSIPLPELSKMISVPLF
jgi:carbon-monoxide dehydrogenase medium subunit